MRNQPFFIIAFIISNLLLPHTSMADNSQTLNIYSSRQEHLIKPLLDQFSEKTGIKVHLLTGKDDALIKRIESEGKNTPADLLLTTDAGRLYRAKSANLLQAIESKVLTDNIPAHLRDTDKTWFGLSVRSRVIMYNKAKVKAEELSSYQALADEKWKGRICIRSSGNIYNQSLLASIIAHQGEAAAQIWAAAMVTNMARTPKGNDRDQMKAAVIGECDLAIANTYYYALWLSSDNPTDLEYAKKLGLFFPNQNDRGAHINISGAGVTRHAKNPKAAIQLIEFLSEDTAQQWYAQKNNEYPVKPGVPVSDTVKSWGYPFKADTLNLSDLGEHNALAVKIFDRVGWR